MKKVSLLSIFIFLVLDPIFAVTYDNLYVVKSGNTYGLMNMYGKILVSPEFNKVTIDEPKFNNYMKYLSEHDD